MDAPAGRPIVLALLALVVLTAASYGMSFVDVGAAGAPLAIAIAAFKAGVVAVVFMELMRASPTARIAGIVTIAFIALLCAGTVSDVALR